ncbi:NAD(P)/FAD-dependent oxidoreductase [Streptomyces olivaceus]|uniref:NAD(P)/FAD-dependent oxidoreductase n=1 Tax=Streptomyces olivaceus TaxID=47716 RepID=UPI00362ED682
MRIVVVGGQITGSALAASLAARGAEVSVVDRPDPAGSATTRSYGWINSHKKHPESYHALNVAGLEHYHRELAEVPGVFEAVGHVEAAGAPAHVTSLLARAERLAGLGYPVEPLTTGELRALEPGLRAPAREARRFPREGLAHPEALVAHFEALARADGARHLTGRVTEVELGGHGAAVALADGTRLTADAVVLCAGLGSSALAASAGLELPTVAPATGNPAVGYLAVTAPGPRVSRLVTTDRLNLRPHAGGGMILQALDLDVDADPAAPGGEAPTRVAEAFAERLAEVLPDAAGTPLRACVGRRVIPDDGLPAVGPVDDAGRLWAVVTHSGVTLGPWLAERTAREMLTGHRDALLGPFSPRRLRGPVTAGGSAAHAPREPGEQ